jgi:DNA-binding MarR family transcriptional regulator
VTTTEAVRPSKRLDERRLKVWQSFLRAHAGLVNTLDNELESERGLPLAWYGVLLGLEQATERKMRMQELAGMALLSFSGLTRLVDRMEEAGMVKRLPCKQDRRGSYATITAEGRRALRRAAPVHLRGIQEHFAKHLTNDEVSALEKALAKVIDASAPGQPGCCDDEE